MIQQIGTKDGRSGEQQIINRNGRYFLAIKVGQRWMYARLFESLDNENEEIVLSGDTQILSTNKVLKPTGYKSADGANGKTDVLVFDKVADNGIVIETKNGLIINMNIT